MSHICVIKQIEQYCFHLVYCTATRVVRYYTLEKVCLLEWEGVAFGLFNLLN